MSFSSSCWSAWSGCATGVPAVTRTSPEVFQIVYVCIVLKPELTFSICVWVCVVGPNKLWGVWMLNVGASLHGSLGTSATPSQLKNNTLHSLHSPWPHCSVKHTQDLLLLLLPTIINAGGHVREACDSVLTLQQSLHVVYCPVLFTLQSGGSLGKLSQCHFPALQNNFQFSRFERKSWSIKHDYFIIASINCFTWNRTFACPNKQMISSCLLKKINFGLKQEVLPKPKKRKGCLRRLARVQ